MLQLDISKNEKGELTRKVSIKDEQERKVFRDICKGLGSTQRLGLSVVSAWERGDQPGRGEISHQAETQKNHDKNALYLA